MSLNIAEILESCQLFSAVQPRGFQRLAVIARLCKFRKGQTIFRDGEECPGVYVVGRGMVRVYKTGPGGKEHVLHIVAPGGTFAEAAAIGGFEVPASAEALAATTCALLPRKGIPHSPCRGPRTLPGDDDGLDAVGPPPGWIDGGRGAPRRRRPDRALPAANAPRRGGPDRTARLEAARGQPFELDERDVFADVSPLVGRRHDCGVRRQSAATARSAPACRTSPRDAFRDYNAERTDKPRIEHR